MMLKNEKERLRELYLANLTGMEQSKVLMGTCKPKGSKDFLNLAKKSLRIVKLLPVEARDTSTHCLQILWDNDKTPTLALRQCSTCTK